MINIEEIQIEERNDFTAVKWGVIAIIYSIIINIIFRIPTFEAPNEIVQYGLSTLVGLLYLSTWVLRILIFIWVVRIAKRLNRPVVTWGIFGLIFPPITLIIIGLQDYKVEDGNIKEIIDKTREEYRAKLQLLRSNHALSENSLIQAEKRLKEKYNAELRKKVCDYIAKEREKHEKKTVQDNKGIQPTTEPDENDSTQTISDDWINDINKCPACGASINDEMTICYECGLSIKNEQQ